MIFDYQPIACAGLRPLEGYTILEAFLLFGFSGWLAYLLQSSCRSRGGDSENPQKPKQHTQTKPNSVDYKEDFLFWGSFFLFGGGGRGSRPHIFGSPTHAVFLLKNDPQSFGSPITLRLTGTLKAVFFFSEE